MTYLTYMTQLQQFEYILVKMKVCWLCNIMDLKFKQFQRIYENHWHKQIFELKCIFKMYWN